MKRFFEEYGGIALAILVVLVLIAILSPVGGKIKGSLKEVTKGFDDKMKNGMNSSGIGFGGSSGGGGTKPEQTVNLTTGQKITIAGKEYTVIEQVEGDQYKVLANELADNGYPMEFGSNNNYATSTIATYLDNEYYNSPSLDGIRDAIVETSIQQTKLNTYTIVNPTDWGEKTDAGKHKVFIPSWKEVTKIYGTTPDGLKAYSNDNWTWLRDTYDGNVLDVNSFGVLYYRSPHNNDYVRPAFVLDLSKVEFTTK